MYSWLGGPLEADPTRWASIIGEARVPHGFEEEFGMGTFLANSLLAWETYQTIMVVLMFGIIIGYLVWKKKHE